MLLAQLGTENGMEDGEKGETGMEGVFLSLEGPDEGVFEVP